MTNIRKRLNAVICLAALSLAATSGQSAPPKHKAPPKPASVVPGGANQVEGHRGKVGDVLFDGHWRFQVLEIMPVATYTLTVPSSPQDFAKYTDTAEEDPTTHVFTPKSGYTFFAVKCRLKNGQKVPQQLDFYLENPVTALADTQETSYPPIAYDMQATTAWVTKPLLPGSAALITVLFAVPPGTVPKDLIFTLRNWADHDKRNVRISLAPAKPATP